MDPFQNIASRHLPPADTLIVSVESRIGYRLPREYRDWVMRINGGRAAHPVFRFGDYALNRWSMIGDLFPIGVSSPMSLENKIEAWRDRLPYGVIPIGHDPGNCNICLDCCGNDPGAVFYYAEPSPDTVDWVEQDVNWFKIAVSYMEFLRKLEPIPRQQ